MKEYVDPTIVTLGTIAELTASLDKCGGSGDAAQEVLANPLSPEYSDDCA